MANVTLHQPTDMLALPTAFSFSPTWGGNGSSITFYNSAASVTSWLALLGQFSLANMPFITGTIAQMSYNLGDGDGFPNLVIDGANLAFDGAYYVNTLETGNIQKLVTDLLAGNDVILGTEAADTLAGFAGNDTLSGLGGDDHLVGDIGRDQLFGGAGDDTLYGGANSDLLVGGPGSDDLTGNRGADTFRFDKVSDSPTTAILPDVIEDFIRSQGDQIDLSRIDANTAVAGNQEFEFIGKGLFTGNATDPTHRGELRYVVVDGALTLLGDVNGDSVADFAISIVGLLAMKATDFIL